MSSDYPPYTRAVKPIDFGRGGVVGVKSPTKQSTWGIVRDFKKLQHVLDLAPLEITPWEEAKQGQLLFLYKVTGLVNDRIANYKQFVVLLDSEVFADSLSQIASRDILTEGTLHVSLMWKVGTVVHRYNLGVLKSRYDYPSPIYKKGAGPFNTQTWNYNNYRNLVQAPWYSGEKFPSTIYIEFWRNDQAYVTLDNLTQRYTLKKAHFVFSKLIIPSDLETKSLSLQASLYMREDIDIPFDTVTFPVVCPNY